MRTRGMLAMLFAGAMLPGIAQAQTKVSFDFDRRADFTRFRTYALQADTLSDNPLVDARILANIESQLAMKGLEKTDTNPDVTVIAKMTYEKATEATVYNSGYWPYGWGYGWGYRSLGYGGWGGYDGWGGWGGWGWGGQDIVLQDIVLGTLTVDMRVRGTNALVWRGTAVREVSNSHKPEKVDRRVRHTVEKVFKNYPPDLDD